MENSALGLNSVGMSVSGCVVWSGVTRASVLVVIEAGQPGGEPLDRGLELRVEVDERAQPLGQPVQRDLLVAAPLASSSIPRSVKYTRARLSRAPASRVMRPPVRAVTHDGAGTGLPVPAPSQGRSPQRSNACSIRAACSCRVLLATNRSPARRTPGGRRPQAAALGVLGQCLRQVERDERPRALVGRLLLHPDQLGARVVLERGDDLLGRQRGELLDPHDRGAVVLPLGPLGDAGRSRPCPSTAAPGHRGGVQRRGVRQDRAEACRG